MSWFLPALAMVLIIEGLGPLLFPNKWRNYLQKLSQQPSNELRRIGGVLVIMGALLLLFFAQDIFDAEKAVFSKVDRLFRLNLQDSSQLHTNSL